MKQFLLRSLLTLFAAWASPAHAQPTLLSPPPAPCEPVNPNATAEARALLKEICVVSGSYILSGQHNFPYHLSRHSERVAAGVGKYPMVWGSDFGFTGGTDQDSIEGRDAMIEEAKRQYAAGSIITLMWHAVRPTEDEPVLPVVGWRGSVQAKLSNDQWAALTTPGTDLNRRWLAQLDVVAGYLKRLQDAKIPVLWRPYHENNGNWFWWGGRKGPGGFQALYRMTFDRLVNYHRLDNLIWVWNTNSPNGKNAGPYHDYYPGPQYVDILATDIYGEYPAEPLRRPGGTGRGQAGRAGRDRAPAFPRGFDKPAEMGVVHGLGRHLRPRSDGRAQSAVQRSPDPIARRQAAGREDDIGRCCQPMKTCCDPV